MSVSYQKTMNYSDFFLNFVLFGQYYSGDLKPTFGLNPRLGRGANGGGGHWLFFLSYLDNAI